MAGSLSSAWSSFWHAMTSYDRHADHDSPYRTGHHVPLPHSRHTPLTSVVTSPAASSQEFAATDSFSPRPSSRSQAESAERDGIPMQAFSNGTPPAPPVQHSWRKINRWIEKNYAELYDNLCEGCTQNDVNELEYALDQTLPLEVRDSLLCHDGQERGGLPTGVLFGCMLLDCEEIVQEWTNWQRVGMQYFDDAGAAAPIPSPTAAFSLSSTEAGPSNASSSASVRSLGSTVGNTVMARQGSLPEGAIQIRYTSPHWIPLARDWGGNCIAVDLCPGPNGRYGQVILFGRDFDTKVVVARSWAAFLSSVADDIEAGKAEIIDDDDIITDGFGIGALYLREFKPTPRRQLLGHKPPIVPFMQVLKIRTENRYGWRRPPAAQHRRPEPSRAASSKGVSKRPSGMSASSPLCRVMEPDQFRKSGSYATSPAESVRSASYKPRSESPAERDDQAVNALAPLETSFSINKMNGNTTPSYSEGGDLGLKGPLATDMSPELRTGVVDKEN